jgi:Putative Ig domain
VSLQSEDRLDPLNPPSLAARTASVLIVPGGISTQTIVDFTNYSVPHGVLEVCKDAAPGTSVTGVFQFTVSGSVFSGVSNALSVAAGTCSGPVLVQAGAVTVTELPTAGFQLVDVQTDPLDRLVNTNIPGSSAVVTVLAGDVSTETVVSFTNSPATAQLKICKIGGTGVIAGQYFNISANGVTYPVPAGPASQGGSCILAGTFPVGMPVTVTETLSPSGAYQLLNITVNPPEPNSPPPNLANGSVTVTAGPGFTEVTFTNIAPTPVNTGQLKICKIAGASSLAGTMFEFNVAVAGNSQTYPPVFVPAGPGPGGYCVVDSSTFPISTPVTVTEAPQTGTTVSSIAVNPTTAGGPCAPASANCELVTISSGFTEVDFTNIAGTAPSTLTITTSLPPGLLNTSYTGTVVATGGTAPYSWSATGLPAGLSINPSTGAIGGTPMTTVTNTPVTFKVTDSSTPALTATATFTLTITALLTITTTSLNNGVVNAAYSQTLIATGGTGAYTWQLTSGTLPSGLTLNAATGVIGGIPTAAVTATPLTFKVTDSSTSPQSTTASFTLTIAGPLTITTTALNNGVVNAAYSQTLIATGGTGPYMWKLAAGRLPSGLTLNSSTGQISGVPAAEVASVVTFQVTDASNPPQTAAAPFTLTVTLTITGLTITTTSISNGVVNVAYSQMLASEGGTGPYTWQLTSGTLPPGLTLDASTGVIGGTPTAPVTATPLTFKVTDSSTPPQNATQTFTLTITTPSTTGLLMITTPSLNNGVVNTAYSQTLAATGGTGPYMWKLTAGRLPSGLTLNPLTGQISGIPAAAVAGSVLTFQVTDASNQMATASLTLTIGL